MFATDYGMFVLNENKNQWQVYTYYDGAFSLSDVTVTRVGSIDEVPDNNISSITEDRTGRIWIGTNEGIVVLSQ